MTDDTTESAPGGGYKKPPDKYKFKPGKSGNPLGRPKGSKNRKSASELDLAQLILDAAAETHEFRQGEKTVTLSRAKAIVDSITAKALKGDHRSQKLFMELSTNASAKKWKAKTDLVGDAIGYKERAERLIEALRAAGQSAQDVLPHPDDVVVDYASNDVSLKGPADKEGRDFLLYLLNREDAWESEVRRYEIWLRKRLSPEDRMIIENDFEKANEQVEEFRSLIDGLWPNAYLVTKHDEAIFGKGLVKDYHVIGLGRPPREFREFAARRRALEERRKKAKEKQKKQNMNGAA